MRAVKITAVSTAATGWWAFDEFSQKFIDPETRLAFTIGTAGIGTALGLTIFTATEWPVLAVAAGAVGAVHFGLNSDSLAKRIIEPLKNLENPGSEIAIEFENLCDEIHKKL